MKELYVKPSIFFESFSFTQTIAKNCGDTHSGTYGQSNHWNETSCAWDVGDFTIFVTGNDACVDCQIDSQEEFAELEIGAMCYNNPEGEQQVFSSC